MDSTGRLQLTALAVTGTISVLILAAITIASLNNQIPDQTLTVNSSSELNLSTYFPEFSGNVWFSVSRTGNISVVFGKSLAEPWKFYRNPSVLIVPFKGWTGEETIEFKATNGTETVRKSVLVRVVPSTTTTTSTLMNLIEMASSIITPIIPIPAKIIKPAAPTQTNTSWSDNFSDSTGISTISNLNFTAGNLSLNNTPWFYKDHEYRKPITISRNIDPWWNSSFLYRIPITINNTAGNLTNYQVAVNLTNRVLDLTGLVGSWHFSEGGSTNRTADSSGFGNDGTCYNMPNSYCNWTNGTEGYGLNFDGTDDYVDVGNSASLNITGNQLTMEAWIYPKEQNVNDYVLSKYGGGAGSGGYGMAITSKADGNFTYFITNDTGDQQKRSPNVTVKLNSWHHMAVTYDGTYLKGYWDGVLMDSHPVSGNIKSTTSNVKIGTLGGVSVYFNGTIDEVRIYNRSLSSLELNKSFCIGAYRLNQSGQTVGVPSYCNDYLRSYSYSWQDLRFTYYNSTSNNQTALNYWLENDKKAWVNVTSLINNTNTTVYMYYGNPSASSASNGTNTFEFFDDFLGTSLDTSKWDQSNGLSGTAVVSGGYLSWKGGGADYQQLQSFSTFGTCIQESKTKVFVMGWFGFFMWRWAQYADFDYEVPRVQSCDGTAESTTITMDGANWHKYKIAFEKDIRVRFYQDDSLSATHITYPPNIDLPVAFIARYATHEIQVDWVFIRKYASPEPSASFGAEQPYSLTDYQVAINLTEAIYNNTGLVGSWHFSEGSGNITKDHSCYDNETRILTREEISREEVLELIWQNSVGGNQEELGTEGGRSPPAVQIYRNPDLLSNSINFPVENTLTSGCMEKSGSFDQIGQLSFNANAKKSISSGSTDKCIAVSKNFTYSSNGINLTSPLSNSINSINSSAERPDFLIISCLCSSISPNANNGENNSSLSDSISSSVLPLRIIVANNTVESTTSFIQTSPCFLSFSNLPLFINLPSSNASLSVNFDFSASNLSNALLISLDLVSCNSKNLSLIDSSAKPTQSTSGASSTTALGIFTLSSGISTTNNYIENYLNKLPSCNEIQEGYCQENGKFYQQGWKLFSELGRDEEVLTLNPLTKEKEWQLPLDYQVYDYDEEMFKITLEDNSSLLVSPEHRVYGLVITQSSLRFLKSDQTNSNLDFSSATSFLSSDRFEVFDSNLPISRNMAVETNKLKSSSSGEWTIPSTIKKRKNIATNNNDHAIILNAKSNLLSISYPFNTLLATNPDINPIINPTTVLKPNSYLNTKLKNSVKATAIPTPTKNALSSFDISNSYDNRYLNNMISSEKSYNMILQGKIIASTPLVSNNFSLLRISDLYEEFSQNPNLSLVFLDEDLNPITVKNIEKVNYSGKIYDVDVPNDIVLVKRENGTELWSGNSNNNDGTMFGNMNTTLDGNLSSGWVSAGKFGNALKFDGVNDYVDAGSAASLNIGSGNFTIEFWMKGNTGTPISRGASNSDYWVFYNPGSNQIKWEVRGFGSDDLTSIAAVYDNNWHNVFLVKEGTTGKFYIDGGLDNTGTLDSTYSETSALRIGALVALNFNGTIDEVRIYNRSLSAAEIAEHYQAGKARLDYADLRFTWLNTSTTNSFDNRTQVLTSEGWKLFSELNGNEDIATLKTEDPRLEWQNPTDYLSADFNGEMFEIELENGEKLSVTPGHRVYGAIINQSSLRFLNSDQSNPSLTLISTSKANIPVVSKVSNVGSVGEWIIPNILSKTKSITAPINPQPIISNAKVILSSIYSPKNLLAINPARTPIITPINALNSSFNSSDRFSNNVITTTTTTPTKTDLSSFDTIDNNKNNYLNNMILQSKIIASTPLVSNNFSLLSISELYGNLEGRELYFLDENMNPVRVKSIRKVPYSGRVYDVDVPNDVVLVRRENIAGTWSGNTNSGSREVEIPYWLESDKQAWVKVPSISVAANTTVYMYYGNPSATYNNSLGGNSTFVFFDDFLGSTLDAGKWDSYANASGTETVSNSIWYMDYAYNSGVHRGTYQKFPIGTMAEMRVKVPSFCPTGACSSWGYATGNPEQFWYHGIGFYVRNGISTLLPDEPTTNVDQDAYRVYRIVRVTANEARYYKDGVEMTGSPRNPTWTEDLSLVWATGENIYTDWVLVRKYASPEPTATTIGSEQRKPRSGSVGSVQITPSSNFLQWDKFSADSLLGWQYKKEINISNVAGNLTNYQVNVKLINGTNFNYSKAQTNGSDIRFTAPLSYSGNGKWLYKKEITVSNRINPSALTDYQVLISLEGVGGTGYNFDFSKAKSDGSDIRFYDPDTKSELSYWIESWNSTTLSAKVWVKIPSIAGNSEKRIWMWYGNSLASSVANGSATFAFFDDFEYGSDEYDIIANTDWVSGYTGSVFKTEGDPKKIGTYSSRLNGTSSYAIAAINITGYPKTTGKYCYEFYFRDNSATVGHNWYFQEGTGAKSVALSAGVTDNYFDYECGAGRVGNLAPFAADTWYRIKIVIDADADTFDLWIDDDKKLTGGCLRSYNPGNSLHLESASPSSHNAYHDMILLRKFSSPEPNITVGSEFSINSSYVEIPYWIESWNSSANSSLWAKVPFLQNNSNTTIYMYYGNPSASSASNGTNTFIKFNDGKITGWNTITSNWIEEAGALKNTGTTIETARMNIDINDYIAEAIVQTPSKSSWQYVGIHARRLDQNPDTASGIFVSPGGNTGEYSMWKGDSWLNTGAYADIQLNTWYAIKMVLNGANVDFYGDPGKTSATTLRLSTTAATVLSGACVGLTSANLANHLYDDFRVRKYASPEPNSTVSTTDTSGDFSAGVTDINYKILRNSEFADWKYRKPITISRNIDPWWNSSFTQRQPITINYTGPGEINTTQLVGLWHMDEGSGNQTNDSSGFGNHGNLTNGTVVCNGGDCPRWNSSGKFSYGIQFDGVNDYVNAGNATSLDITSAITIEAWVKFYNNPDGSSRIVDKSHTSCVAPYTMYDIRMAGSTNQFAFDIASGGSSSVLNGIKTDWSANVWHHVVGVYNGSKMFLYVDGTLDNSKDQTGNIDTNDEPILIGKHKACGSEHFNGTIDEVRIYNRSLNSSEIQEHYNAELKNYQVQVNVTYDSDMQPDYDDLRFTFYNSSIPECYDNETEILTPEGWKFFWELNKEEEVATLNPETHELEWNKPEKYQIYDHSGDMFEITLKDNSSLLVSPEHKVYGAVIDKNQISPKSSNNLVVLYTLIPYPSRTLNRSSLDQSPICNPEFLRESDKATYGTSLICGDSILTASEPKSANVSSLTTSTSRSKSFNISLNSDSEILDFEQISSLFLINSLMQSEGVYNLSSNDVINFLVAESLLNTENKTFISTTSLIYSHPFSPHSLITLSSEDLESLKQSSSVNSDLSRSLFNLLRIKTLANLTFTTDIISSLNSDTVNSSILIPGTLTTNSAISTTPNNNTQDNYLNAFSLEKITEIYQKLEENPDLGYYFLDSENNPVKVLKIEKVPYSGKIYDVTVENHIILVRRNGIPVWSGNSHHQQEIPFWYEIASGQNSTRYQVLSTWSNESFIPTPNFINSSSSNATLTINYENNTISGITTVKVNGYTIGTISDSTTPVKTFTNLSQSNLTSNTNITYTTTGGINITSASISYHKSPGKFWVKVPSIINGTGTLYMYYGNPSASSASNGTNTFDFFDDFEDGTWSDKWTLQYGSTNPTESGGIITVANDNVIASIANLGINTILEGKVNVKATNSDASINFASALTFWSNAYQEYNSPGDGAQILWFNIGGWYFQTNDGGAGGTYNGLGSYTTGWKNNNRITWRTGAVDYVSDASTATHTTDLPTQLTQKVMLGENADFDDIRVRKYASPEPAASFGAEQPYSLTDYQVAVNLTTAIYNNTGLVGSWHFSEGSGNRTADHSCYDNETKILTREEISREEILELIRNSVGGVRSNLELKFPQNKINCYSTLEEILLGGAKPPAVQELMEEIRKTSSLVSPVVMVEGKKGDYLSTLINLELENETLEDVNPSFSGKVMPQWFVMSRIPENLLHLLSEDFSQDWVLSAGFINGSLTGGHNLHDITHFIVSKNSSTELNLSGVSFLAFSSLLTNSSLNGNSSTGCQSILSQNSHSSSEIVPVFIYPLNISFFIDSSLATEDQLTQEKCLKAALNLSGNDIVMLAIFYDMSSNFTSSISISPFLTICSNFQSCFNLTLNRSFRYSGQFTSGCSSILFFNSSGMDTVNVAILHSQNSVNTQNWVNIYNDFYLNKLPSCQKIQEGYCQEDGKFYQQEWKLFSELSKQERVATLNPEDRKLEWQKPTDYQEYDYNEEMFKITLEGGSELIVSPEHRVYGLVLDKSESSLDSILSSRFISAFIPPRSCSILNEFTESASSQPRTKVSGSGECNNPIVSKNSSKITKQIIPHAITPRAKLTKSLPYLLYTSKVPWSLSTITPAATPATDARNRVSHQPTPSSKYNKQAVARNTTTPDHKSLLSFDSSISKYNTGDYLNSFSLERITEIYQKLDENPDLEYYFLDSEKNPIKVLKIEKVPYSGKIYDVDVENDIVLVKRGNGTELWSGNSNNNDGTMYGNMNTTLDGNLSSGWVSAGKFGNALKFDGVDDYVDCGSPSSLGGLQNITLEAWVKLDSLGREHIISGKDNVAGDRYWQFGIRTSNKPYIYFFNQTNNAFSIDPGNTILTTGRWYHIIATHNGSTISLYVDGNLDSSTPAAFTLHTGTTTNVYIARYSTLVSINGTIDEVRIYNRSLSAAEISEHYQAGKARLDYADLRFTWVNSTNNTEQSIPYWLENDKQAWVKVPNISVAANATVYMYYGNPSATYNNSLGGNQTFEFFDDFEGTSLDTSKWDPTTYGSGGAASVSGGYLSWIGGGANYQYMESISSFDTCVQEFRGKFLGSRTYGGLIYGQEVQYAWWDLEVPRVCNRDDVSYTCTTITMDGSNWHKYKIAFEKDTRVRYYKDDAYDTPVATHATYPPNVNLPIGFGARYATDNIQVDWVLVRKYASPEPTALSVGSEQNNTLCAGITAEQAKSGSSIAGCAGNSTPISLYAVLETQDPRLTTPRLRQWNVTWSVIPTPPQIVLNTPANNSVNNTRNINFTFTPTDSDGFSSCELFTNQSGSFASTETKTGITSGVLTGINWTFGSDGVYLWNIKCTDVYGTSNFSAENRTITVDITAPSINFTSPTPENNSYVARNSVLINISVNDSTQISSFIDWNKSLAGYWRFENNVYDNGTWGNNASLGNGSSGTSPIYTQGKFGKGLQFNTSSLAIVNNSASLEGISSSLTVEAWVQITSAASVRQYIIEKRNASQGFELFVDSDNVVNFVINTTKSTLQINPGLSSTLSLNQWYYITAVYENSTNSSKLYINSRLNVTGNVNGTINNNDNITIGALKNSSGYYNFFNGTIDEVRLWNRVLGEDEINASYSTGLGFLHNFTNLSDGSYSYYGFSTDIAGNANKTGTRILTIDTTYPVVSFSSETAYWWNSSWAYRIPTTISRNIDPWWNSSFAYRIPITINNTAGNLTNYQVSVNLTSSRAPSLNWSRGGNDTRFIYYNSSSGTHNNLNYWLESWNSTANTSIIWVNVTSLINNTNTTVYMYYGNPSASSASNGTNTFEFFDDFEDGITTDAGDLWITGATNYASTAQKHSGSYSFFPSVPTNGWYSQSLGQKTWNSIVTRMWVYLPDTTGRDISLGLQDNDAEDWNSLGPYIKFDDGAISTYNGTSWSSTSITYTAGWHSIEIRWKSQAKFDVRYDDGSWVADRDTLSDTNDNIDKIIVSISGATGTGYYDDFVVRKYASPEPAASFGSEQPYSLTNYQVYINLTSSRVGSNFNWGRGGNDTRFIYYNSTSGTHNNLNYWIESWNSTANTSIIWVNVTSLINNTNTTIYMYYGNPSATSQSNGTAVFEFFDDFEYVGAPDSSKWTEYDQGTNVGVSDGKLQITGTNVNNANGVASIPTFDRTSQGYSFEFRHKYNALNPCIDFAYGPAPLVINTYVTLYHTNAVWAQMESGAYSFTGPPVADTWFRDTVKFKILNDVEVTFGAESKSGTDSRNNAHVSIQSAYTRTAYIDWILVRKYASPEPAASFGAEQPNSTGTAGNNSYFNRNWIYANWKITEINFANISAGIWNSSGQGVNITNSTTAFYEINWSLTDVDERYYYNVTVCDLSGNCNWTETRIITLDNISPVITWNLPANDNSSIVGGWFVQNVTVNDTNLADLNCTITNSSANVLWTSWWNLTGYNNFTVSNWTNLSGWNTGYYNETCIARDLTFFFSN